MTNQLVLTDRTLRVLGALLPHGYLADQVHAARDPYSGGRLSCAQLGTLTETLVGAFQNGSIVVSLDALCAARQEVEEACVKLDDGTKSISVFVWDAERDGPLPIPSGRRDAG